MVIQEGKTHAALNIEDDIYRHLLSLGDGFIRKAHKRVADNHRSPECQADYEAFHNEVLPSYIEDVVTTARLGVRSIQRIVHEEPPMPAEERRGFLRWLFG